MPCKKNGGLIAVIIAIFMSLASAKHSHGETFQSTNDTVQSNNKIAPSRNNDTIQSIDKHSLSVEIKGAGPALIFIPGLDGGK